MRDWLMEIFNCSSVDELLCILILFFGVLYGIVIGFCSSCGSDLLCSYQARKCVKFLEKYILTNKSDPEEKE